MSKSNGPRLRKEIYKTWIEHTYCGNILCGRTHFKLVCKILIDNSGKSIAMRHVYRVRWMKNSICRILEILSLHYVSEFESYEIISKFHHVLPNIYQQLSGRKHSSMRERFQ